MEAVDTRGGLALVRFQPQVVGDVNTPYDQHTALGFDLADRLRSQVALSSRDSARFQRASKRSGQSPRGCSDKVVECRIMRFLDLGTHPIVLGDL